jgi:hypothetical protein
MGSSMQVCTAEPRHAHSILGADQFQAAGAEIGNSRFASGASQEYVDSGEASVDGG